MSSHRSGAAVVLAAVVLVAVMLGGALTGRADAAPVQWPVAAGGNGHWYEVVVAGAYDDPNPPKDWPSISWPDASAAAAARGGYLATIASAAENLFVLDLCRPRRYWDWDQFDAPSTAAGPWLGAYATRDPLDQTPIWHWVTGEPFTYTNWAVFQPDDDAPLFLHYYTAEAIVQIDDVAPTWGNFSFPHYVPQATTDHALAYVVEYDVVPEPGSGVGLGVVGVGVVWGRRRRR